jgi:hypothetical protein
MFCNAVDLFSGLERCPISRRMARFAFTSSGSSLTRKSLITLFNLSKQLVSETVERAATNEPANSKQRW